MDFPLLTIAVPTFNGEKTICNLLDRLLPQIDWSRVEVIVSDNCSTDGTADIVKAYREVYPRMRVVRNSDNIGPDANFLQCMKLASGEFTHLISDDDILIEGGLSRVLGFLEANPKIALAYLHTVCFRIRYVDAEHCFENGEPVARDVCTCDKKEFMEYAKHYWGFMSSFLWRTDKFRALENPEKYYRTYWLQSYIHIHCSGAKDDLLGVVAGPIIAAGAYMNVVNLDTARVDGIFYKKMLDEAIENGYDRAQLNKWYLDRLYMLASHAIVKERAAGIIKTRLGTLFQCTYPHLSAWIRLYPFFLVPSFLCRIVAKKKRAAHGQSDEIALNRLD